MAAQQKCARIWLAMLACAACAQDAACLTGSIVDSSGAAVPGANIELSFSGSTTPVSRALANDQGLFTIPGLRPGAYDLAVSATGFQRQTIRELRLETGRELSLSTIKMEIGAVAETVEVVANTAAIQTSNAEISRMRVLTVPSGRPSLVDSS